MSNRSTAYDLEDSIIEQLNNLTDRVVRAEDSAKEYVARSAEQASTVLMCEGVIGLFMLYINENNLIQDFEDWAGTVAQRIRERNPEANGNAMIGPGEAVGSGGSGNVRPGPPRDEIGNVRVPQEIFVGEEPGSITPCDCDLCNGSAKEALQTESSW